MLQARITFMKQRKIILIYMGINQQDNFYLYMFI